MGRQQSGRKRHWSQAALGAAGGLAKAVYRGYRMARVAHRARAVVRRVIRRRPGARRGTKGSERVGVFTKCWDKKVRHRRRSARSKAFAKRVRNVMATDLAKVSALVERSVAWPISVFSGSGVAPNVERARVSWCQFGLSVLNGADYVQSYYDPYACTVANPAGLNSLLKTGSTFANNMTSSSGVSSTILSALSAPSGAVNPTLNSGTMHRWRLGPRRMHVTLRNPFPYGFWLDIFYCRNVRSVRNDEIRSVPTGLAGQNYYGASSTWYGTPLECMAHGYSFVSDLGCRHHGLMKQASPQESPTFRRHWKITKKCRVYMPAGGTLEKALVQQGTRTMTSDYAHQYCVDRFTEYLLIKAVPEVQYSSGGNVGQPAVASAIGDGLGFESMIGDATWRYSYRQVQTNDVTDEIGVSGYVPVITTLEAGQAEPTHRTI